MRRHDSTRVQSSRVESSRVQPSPAQPSPAQSSPAQVQSSASSVRSNPVKASQGSPSPVSSFTGAGFRAAAGAVRRELRQAGTGYGSAERRVQRAEGRELRAGQASKRPHAHRVRELHKLDAARLLARLAQGLEPSPSQQRTRAGYAALSPRRRGRLAAADCTGRGRFEPRTGQWGSARLVARTT